MTMNTVDIPQNMGDTDRLIRATLGGMLLMSSLDHLTTPFWRNTSGWLGSSCVIFAFLGYDPLMHLLGTNSFTGNNQNVSNKIKRSKIGQQVIERVVRESERVMEESPLKL